MPPGRCARPPTPGSDGVRLGMRLPNETGEILGFDCGDDNAEFTECAPNTTLVRTGESRFTAVRNRKRSATVPAVIEPRSPLTFEISLP